MTDLEKFLKELWKAIKEWLKGKKKPKKLKHISGTLVQLRSAERR